MSNLYLFSYDKIKDRNYQPLWNALKEIGAHKSLYSLWLIESNTTAEKIRNYLMQFMDSNDRWIVAEIEASNTVARGLVGTNKLLTVYA